MHLMLLIEEKFSISQLLTVYTQLHVFFRLSPLLFLLGRQNLKTLFVRWILMHIKAFSVLSPHLIA